MNFKEKLTLAVEENLLAKKEQEDRKVALREQRAQREKNPSKEDQESSIIEEEFSTFLEGLVGSYLENFKQVILNGTGEYFVNSESRPSGENRVSVAVEIGLNWETSRSAHGIFKFQFIKHINTEESDSSPDKNYFPLKMSFRAGRECYTRALQFSSLIDNPVENSEEMRNFVEDHLLATARGKVNTYKPYF